MDPNQNPPTPQSQVPPQPAGDVPPPPQPPTPVSPAPVPPPPPPSPSSTNKLMIALVLFVVLLILGAGGVYLYLNYFSAKPTPQVSPSPSSSSEPSPSGTPDITAGWQTYTNPTYGFELKYPSTYKVTEDKYGWPKSVLLLYKGGQSYDLVVEVWSAQSDYEAKYKNQMDALTVKQKGGNFITLLNMNKDPEVAQIISTFKFTGQISESENPVISAPAPASKVASPLIVRGAVPSGWMFEGVFPIKLLDANKNTLASGQAKETIAGAWQSGQAVAFTATLTFTAPASGSGTIILQNDNPSGDPSKTKSFEVPVSF